MLKTGKRIRAFCITGMAVILGGVTVWGSAHFNDASKVKGSGDWNTFVQKWNDTASDYTNVSITPGCAQTEINFAWYSKADGAATSVVHFGENKNSLQAFSGTTASVDSSLTGGVQYDYNYVTVTGLQENRTYYYTVEKNGAQSEVKTFKTGSFENVNILYVGDPQIGASKGQSQDGETLANTDGVANTAARNDSYGWNRTLETAAKNNPGLNFIISAGDQVNKTGKPKEEEYAGYLSPALLSSIPEATTIGNHDSLNPDYAFHFNNPNPTGNGKTQAGGDYYYRYGAGLFIVLNTNNYNAAEHAATVKKATDANPDAKWRIVTIHQDVYGSGLDHSDTDGMILRTQLTPVFDQYGIDVVLQGHDHTYSRSKILHGDGQSHQNYEFRLNDEGSDYDWDHAYNKDTGDKIPLTPAADDADGTAAKAGFSNDNKCYTTADSGSTVTDVTNPKGTLYMTANSASGSKYYELIPTQQDYIANRSQNWLPSYSVINMTSSSFTITTWQIKDDGSVERLDQPFTIRK